jgi:alpha-tubulin suppressor-like RCC1 family protein
MSRPNQFLSPEGDIEEYFVDEYWLIDQYVGDQLWIWGSKNNGKLGNADIFSGSTSTPITTFAGGTNWKQVSIAGRGGAAIKTDGTLWTWGEAVNGRLGNGATTGNISTLVTTFAGGTNWKQVACGYSHVTAIKTDGTLWTWGGGSGGRLGNGATTGNISTPVTTFAGGNNWKQVSASSNITAAIKTDGTLWTWGYGSSGALGNAQITNRSTPITTFSGGTNWKQVSCGHNFTAAIKTDGTLWTWGLNGVSGGGEGDSYYAYLGINQVLNVFVISTPVTTFAGGTNWKQVSVAGNTGGNNLGAIKTDGTFWTWGENAFSELGHAATNKSYTPITTFAGGTNWKLASGGYQHNTAIKTDGTLWTWGSISDGALGNGVTSGLNRSTPITTFAGGTNWKQVIGGRRFTAAVQAGINAEYPLS